MAEFAASALASAAAASGAAAAAATPVVGIAGSMAVPTFGAAAATGGILSSIGGISTVASILGGTATVASVLAASRAGDEKARALELSADDAETEGMLEINKGSERRAGLRRQLIATLGERDVAAAASGIDLSFGTPAQARKEAVRDAEDALDTDQTNEQIRRARLAERAGSYRRMAVEARSGGLARAASLALEGGARLARRG